MSDDRTLSELEKQVAFEVDRRYPEVFDRFLIQLKLQENTPLYLKLAKYVEAKIALQRLRKSFHSDFSTMSFDSFYTREAELLDKMQLAKNKYHDAKREDEFRKNLSKNAPC